MTHLIDKSLLSLSSAYFTYIHSNYHSSKTPYENLSYVHRNVLLINARKKYKIYSMIHLFLLVFFQSTVFLQNLKSFSFLYS
jgi:hypothetical protein